MRRSAIAALGICVTCTSSVRADTLGVGPGLAYATPCAAVAAAKPHDDVAIAPGMYTDSCAITLEGLTLHGAGGVPTIDLSGTDHPAQYKAIYVIAAADVTIEDLELTGAHISDANGANGAALRVEASGLTVRRCNIHDNQNGLLGGTTGTLTIEHSEFFNNGRGDGCNQGGCTHNVYVANIDTLNFRFNWSHRVATDTNDKGHLLKSRAKANYVLYNRLTGEDGFDSYELDFPNGGLAIVVGNQIEKGPKAGNPTLLSWGEEGASNADKRVFLVNNTFVNDYGTGKFISAAGATLTAHNNIFAGTGSVDATIMSNDNWVGNDPQFVDATHYDCHLRAGSPAIGRAIDPGMADQFSLTPTSQYVQPVADAVRATAHDSGAFEFATSAAGSGGGSGSASQAGVDGGSGAMTVAGSDAAGSSGRDATADAGSHAAGSAGAAAGSAAPAAGNASSARAKGCSCAVLGAPRAPSQRHRYVIALGIALLSSGSRVRRRSRR